MIDEIKAPVGYFEEAPGHKSSARLNATLAICAGLAIAIFQAVVQVWHPETEINVTLISMLLALGFGGKVASDLGKK